MKQSKKAFTLVEMLIVISILSIAISALFNIFLSYNSWSNFKKKIIQAEIQNIFDGTWRNSITWNSVWNSLEWEKDNKYLLPWEYHMVFSSENSKKSKIFSLETQNIREWSSKYTRVIRKKDYNFGDTNFYIKKIIVKSGEDDTWYEVSSISFSFKNPTGSTSIYSDSSILLEEGQKLSSIPWNTIHEFNELVDSTWINQVEIVFHWYSANGEDEYKFKAIIHRDKILLIDDK